MYRSASSTRVSEDYFNYNTSPPKVSSAMRALSLESSELPLYEPFSTSSEVAKKDKSRLKFGENGVHLIPIILILCAFILWFFSNPGIIIVIPLIFMLCACLFLWGLNTNADKVWILNFNILVVYVLTYLISLWFHHILSPSCQLHAFIQKLAFSLDLFCHSCIILLSWCWRVRTLPTCIESRQSYQLTDWKLLSLNGQNSTLYVSYSYWLEIQKQHLWIIKRFSYLIMWLVQSE